MISIGIYLWVLLNFFLGLFIFVNLLLYPLIGLAFDTSDPSVSLSKIGFLIIFRENIARLFKMGFPKMKQ